MDAFVWVFFSGAPILTGILKAKMHVSGLFDFRTEKLGKWE